MPIYVTVILDSGCFLPSPSGYGAEIGYFGSSDSVSDIRIVVDGVEVDTQLNLGKKSKIEVRHLTANGRVKQGGAKEADGFHDKILRLRELYGKDIPVDRSKFGCILRFDSGLFCAAMVKPRLFRKHDRQSDGKLALSVDYKPKYIKPIAHNVNVQFTLNKEDALELVMNGKVIWSSKNVNAKGRIDIEFVADNTTWDKFYVTALRDSLPSYWLPNDGDPPPMQPEGGPIFGDGRHEEKIDAQEKRTRKKASAKPDQPQKRTIVPVFYGTTRQRTGAEAPNDFYGHMRGEFEYGICEVSIPESHIPGEVERPSIWKFWRLDFTENPEKHIVLLNINIIPESGFFGSLSNAINNSEKRSALVFVHGFNVTFAEAARRTAQLAVDLQFDGVPVFYSWPSKGKLSKAGYRHDANNVGLSAIHLEKFLVDIASKSGAKALHLIAHSMGNQALTSALEKIALRMKARVRPTFSEVVLTAPDIDADLFRQLAQVFHRAADHITLYASSNDQALLRSKKYQGGYPRAGHAGDGIVVVQGIDSIDASEVDTSFVGHSYYGDNDSVLSDLFYLLKDRKPPNERFGLVPKVCKDGKYWAFRPKKR